MIKNFREIIDQIKAQVPIQELISEYITIKKSGRGYVALCPFHNDHHPSLQIHPQKGIFKCFSCGTGGDLITFYTLINKKNHSEAIPELASKYGIKVEYDEENKTKVQIKNQLYELNKVALNYYKNNLVEPKNKKVLNYLQEERKLSFETIGKYGLGFAENSWDSLYNYLSKEKLYSQELLVASGLFILKESTQSYYDRFRNRIIIPIYNDNNNIIGFGGRTLEQENNETAKYINSPETIIFNKGYNLYGLNFAKDEIKKTDYVILTEGYFDVINAHQHGLLNTVGTLGTALTIQQARLLTKYTDSKKVYLCLDTDLAGKKAVESIFRLIQELSEHISLDLRVINNLSTKDLDEALKVEDINSIINKIKDGQKIEHFVFDRIINEYTKADKTNDDISKKDLINEAIEIISSTRDQIKQKENIKYLSHKLNIDEEILNSKVKDKLNKQRQRYFKFNKTKDDTEDTFKMHSIERFKYAELELLSLYICSFPDNNEIKEEINKIDFIDDKHKLIKEALDNLPFNIKNADEVINHLILEYNEYKHIMSAISDLAWRIEDEESSYSKNKEKIINEAKNWINWWVTNKQKMKTLTSMLKESKDTKEETEILSQMIKLVKNST